MPEQPFQGRFLNATLSKRLLGINEMLMSAHQAGIGASAATKGFERETFVNSFLSQVFPPVFRFGSGDIIDQHDQQSGQLDIVVEFPFVPSIQTIATGPRLYLAENVAAAIEVKSDISKQLKEVKATSKKIKALNPRQGGCVGRRVVARDYTVPFFAVSFEGWRTVKKARSLIQEGCVDGVLILKHGVSCGLLLGGDGQSLTHRIVEQKPDAALWLFVSCLHDCITRLQSMTAHPCHYFK